MKSYNTTAPSQTAFNKTYIWIIFCFICLHSFSCRKFVDIESNSRQTLIETSNDCQLLLNDYANMNVGFPSDGEASSDDYYFNDARFLASAITIEDQNIYSWQYNALRTSASPQWQYSYKVIYISNLVLEALSKQNPTDNHLLINDIRGQALFYRAYSFYNLAQLYAKPYNSASAKQDLGIPLRLGSDINAKSERGTLEQTYSQIINDLTESVNLLSEKLIVPSRPNKAAAYAMLARVYLSQEDYQNALTNANAALQFNSQLLDYNTISTNSATPFTRFNKEVIFHSLMAVGNILNPGTATVVGAKINEDLYVQYGTNDLRKKIFFKENSQSAQLLNPAYPTTLGAPQFLNVTLPDGTYRFTGNYEPAASAALFNGLAVDEMFLIRAECYARTDNVNAALNDLNSLLVKRWVTGTYVTKTAISASDALNQILTERRKELLMRGQRWTDGRRLKLNFARQTKSVIFSGLSNSPIRTVSVSNSYNLPAGDLRFTLLIPNEVIINSTLSQNSRQ